MDFRYILVYLFCTRVIFAEFKIRIKNAPISQSGIFVDTVSAVIDEFQLIPSVNHFCSSSLCHALEEQKSDAATLVLSSMKWGLQIHYMCPPMHTDLKLTAKASQTGSC